MLSHCGPLHGRPKLPVELLWRLVEFMQDFRLLVLLRKELPQAVCLFVCLLDQTSTLLIHPSDYTPMHLLVLHLASSATDLQMYELDQPRQCSLVDGALSAMPSLKGR